MILAATACCAVVAQADVFNMGTGITSLETVQVGNPGNAADTAAHSGNPAGQGAVGYNYAIGKYEVTAGQYAEFLKAVADTDTYGLYNGSMDSTPYGCQITRHGVSGSYTYDFSGRPSGEESDWANRPVNYVSYWDASRFANWLHNGQPTGAQGAGTTETGAYTLTSDGISGNTIVRNADWKWAVTNEDEWYKAAYHDKTAGTAATYFNYPTSNNSPPGRDITDVSGNNANYSGTPFPIDSGKYTTLVGEFQNSDSPYGTFDQSGNVFEWNESVLYSWARGQRGGGWPDYTSGLASPYRSYSGPTFEFEVGHVGFRVASVPEPGSLAMLLGLALSALWYGWRRRG
jgi:formylglycine-generating enzyme required for sulfatase activity